MADVAVIRVLCVCCELHFSRPKPRLGWRLDRLQRCPTCRRDCPPYGLRRAGADCRADVGRWG